jgi:hypothetical protein
LDLNSRAADRSNSTVENFQPQAGDYPADGSGFSAARNPGFANGI